MAMDLTFCFLHYKSRPICEIKCLFRCSTSNSIAHLWPILSQFNYKCNVSQTHLCTMSNKLFWSQQKQGADFWANLSKTDFVLLKLFEVRRDIRVLGPQRLECFDSTAWNRYYSIVLSIVSWHYTCPEHTFPNGIDWPDLCWETSVSKLTLL